jgi:exopolysaccharide biosynthesis polyprenyl glycosylphosphotransferase
MRNARRRVMNNTMKLFDMVLVVVSFGVAALPVKAQLGLSSFAQLFELKVKVGNLLVFSTLLVLWHGLFSILGLYDSKRLAGRKADAIDVMKATTLAALLLLLCSYWAGFRMVTPSFVLRFWALNSVLTVSTRMVLRTWLRHVRMRGRDSRNMLIVGSNQRAIQFAKMIQSQPELGYRIIGFADEEWAGVEELQKQGWPLICGLDELGTFLRRHVVDEVVLGVPLRSFHDLGTTIAAMCQQQGIIFRILSDLFNLQSAHTMAEEFDGATVVTHSAGIAEGWPRLIKRALDVILSLALLIIIAPLLLLTVILIKLTSPGPVLFVQRRIGLNKRTFDIYKFRTMVADAEQRLQEVEHLNEATGPVFKIRNDPRMTPLGRILRKTSIDELPQLFNVLAGDMSLVGPRPLQVRDYELLTERGEDWQRCRFSVPPGITCLWQVNGRSLLPFDQWMELDLQYVRNWSLWLDFRILAKTVPAVFRGSGAG